MPLSFDVEPRRPVPAQPSTADRVRWIVRIALKRNRVLVEHHPNKAAAVARAEALWQHLDANDALPDQL